MAQNLNELINRLRSNADNMARPKTETVSSNVNKPKPIKVLKTFLVQFIYKQGNGWAIINATSINEAESVFKRQTKYEDAIITGVKETKWYGNNIQLVFEGVVTTSTLVNVDITLSDLINNSDAFATADEYLESVFKRLGYTKEEIDAKLKDITPNINVDLSNYYTKSQIDAKLKDIATEGKPGETPYIKDGYWYIGETSTGVLAQGPQGDPGETPSIDIIDGYWHINGENTGVPAIATNATISYESLTQEQIDSLKGVGISSLVSYFGVSRSNSVPTVWSTTKPTLNSEFKYLWLKLHVEFSNNGVYESTPVIIGNYSESSGQPGYSSNITIVSDESQSTEEENTIYFFLNSLLQAVGSYNNLLKNKEENSVTYSPKTLYTIDADRNFNIVEDNDSENPIITVKDNRVYCYNRITTMFKYGKVLPSQTIKYADSSDLAMLSFIVEGNFFSDITEITLSYNSSVVSVELLEDTTWIPINSGYTFKVTNIDYFLPRRLKIKRLDSDYNTSLTTMLNFFNGYENTSIKVIFSPTVLFYKDGICYNGFDVNDQTRVINSSGNNYYNNGTLKTCMVNNINNGYFSWYENGSRIKVVENYPIDFSKYNIATAVFKWTQPTTSHRWESPNGPSATTLGRGNAYGTSLNKNILIWQLGFLKGPFHNVRLNETRNCDLLIYRGTTYASDGSSPQVKELSISTYPNPY